MPYTLRDGVTFCVIDGQSIFLDINADRYFCLNATANHSFAELVGGADPDHEQLQALRPLLDAGLLVRGNSALLQPQAPPCCPEESLSERWAGSARPFAVVHMLSAQAIWHQRLRRGGFHDAIRHLRRLKRDATSPPSPDLGDAERRLIDAFLMSGRARNNRDLCLMRSFTLVGSLAKKGCAVDMVLGVRAAPFGAHCWAQHRHQVLNDDIDHVRSFTPILVL